MKDCRYLKYNFNYKDNTQKAVAVIFWILAILCMVAIFMLSNQTGDESKELSENVRGLFFKLIGNILDSFIVRKFAHFFEYLALAFLLSCALFMTRKRFSPIPAFAASLIYSVSDEIHQYFIPERACRVFDVFVDSCGAVLGILIFAALLALINLIVLKRKNKAKNPQS